VAGQIVSESAAPGLRERNKAKRRDAILDSVLSILRDSNISDLSIDRVAVRAEVSPATVYNLVGTRDEMFLACVDRVVEKLVVILGRVDPADDPVATALMIVEVSANVFIEERDAFKQILGAVNSSARSGRGLAFDPGLLQVRTMEIAQARGLILEDVDAAAVGRQVYLSYNGAMFAWAAGQLDDNGLRIAVRHGLWTALAAVATEEHRSKYLERMIDTSAELTRSGYGQGSPQVRLSSMDIG
jgi:AcrR family transcriptional regulator